MARDLRRVQGLLRTLARREERRALWLRISAPQNLFQPYGATSPDRYPYVFAFVRDQIGQRVDARLLSFGCSTGDEVASLRRYFPSARIRGIDISRANIKACRKRRDLSNDPDVDFVKAGSAASEPESHYDAIFCMAVFRHGRLGGRSAGSCADLIDFRAFERTVTELAQRLKPEGILVIDHTNFRFTDTAVSGAFECIRSRPRTDQDREKTPLFGPDNLAIPSPAQIGTVFRKRLATGPLAAARAPNPPAPRATGLTSR